MYLFFEKVLIGGVSYISKRYSNAKYKHLKSYEPNQKSKHITYLDANNTQCLSFFQQVDSNE